MVAKYLLKGRCCHLCQQTDLAVKQPERKRHLYHQELLTKAQSSRFQTVLWNCLDLVRDQASN